MLKIGLVGVGGISGAHIPAWERMEGAELVAMCDIRPERLAQYPDKRHYTDLDEMLEKEQLDILDICTPTYLHAKFAAKALERGISAISEKPLSLDPEDAGRLFDLAEKTGAKFMVAQCLRFWREYVMLKQLYDDRTYGSLRSLSMWRLSSMPKWSWDNWMRDIDRSGLSAFDMHVHDLDFCIYAFGAPKKTHQHRTLRPDQDAIQGTYIYDGFYVTAESGWYIGHYPFSAGFRAQFDEAVLEYRDGNFLLYKKDGSCVDLNQKAETASGVINLPNTDSYENELRHFAECVRTGRAPIVTREQAETVLRIAKAYSDPENIV